MLALLTTGTTCFDWLSGTVKFPQQARKRIDTSLSTEPLVLGQAHPSSENRTAINLDASPASCQNEYLTWESPGDEDTSMTDLSGYRLESLREGPDFAVYCGRQPGNPSDPSAVCHYSRGCKFRKTPTHTLTWEECTHWRSLKRRISYVVEMTNGTSTGNGGATDPSSLPADWALALFHFSNIRFYSTVTDADSEPAAFSAGT